MAFKRGHYIDSGLSPEEREKACIEAEKENEKLTSWDIISTLSERRANNG